MKAIGHFRYVAERSVLFKS